MMKRTCLLILALLLALCCGTVAQGVTVTQSRDGLWYYEDHGNTAELYKYLGSGTSVTVPKAVDGKTVTALTQTFYGRSEITSIALPDTLLEIGYAAFSECSGLTSLILPAGLTSIGEGAFFNCSGLTALTVPQSVQTIGKNALYGCANIETLTLPSSCAMEIGDYAFANWTKLEALSVPDGTASVGQGAFFGCSALKTLVIPDSVRTIGENPFWNNDASGRVLETLRLPAACTMTIGEHEFMRYRSLTSIDIPEGVAALGAHAFCECDSLSSVMLPSTLRSIDEGAFRDCPNLKALDIPDGVTSFADGIFDHDCILTVGQNSQARSYAEGHGLQYIIRETGEQHIDTQSSAQTVEEKVDEIVSSLISGGLSEYDKAMRLHNWLTGHANYTQLDVNDPVNAWVFEPEGVLLHGEGVCQSYTDAYALLLNKAGIANTNAESDSHTWNVVKLDGKWYHIDVTWDDPTPGGGENHDWFGLSDYALEGVSEHEMENSPPSCSAYALNYHYLNGNLNGRLEDARNAIREKLVVGEREFSLQIESWGQGDNRGLKGRTCALILRDEVLSLPDGKKVKLETSWDQVTNTLLCKATAEAPSTEVLTTEAPSTEVLTTEAPTTEVPTTEAPTTEAPATEAPTTENPTAENPTTETPATEEPATEAPSTADEDRIPGDADGNGTTNLQDVLVILRYLDGQETDINVTNADADGDGDTDLADAALILQYACGWDVALR